MVERGTELVDFSQDEQGVTARLVKHEGDQDVEETMRAGYLVGADGARSELFWLQEHYHQLIHFLGVVRKKLGLTFLGVTRPAKPVVIADIEMTGLSSDVSVTRYVL